MVQEFRRSFLNIIPKADGMWDVQEKEGRCEIGTGQEPNSGKKDDDDDKDDDDNNLFVYICNFHNLPSICTTAKYPHGFIISYSCSWLQVTLAVRCWTKCWTLAAIEFWKCTETL